MFQDYVTLAIGELKRVSGKYIILQLDLDGKDYIFRAGKHVTISLPGMDTDSQKLSRILSISSSPNNRKFLRFATIYREASDFKHALSALRSGNLVNVSSPSGGFFLISDRQRPIVFITSGIGITPVISILNWAHEEKLSQRIHLIYVNTSAEDALFVDELEGITSGNSLMTMHQEITSEGVANPGALITGSYLKNAIPDIDLSRAMFYVSGKPLFVHAARKAIMAAGTGAGSIKVESFSGY